ncbi:hypothetical protein BDZ45DRAFT_686220 [Acephala macrosclerotiorum]|nr:hypothetical protein BDZ45DRAFT_686220 [Acephala macrosclerotiorum]
MRISCSTKVKGRLAEECFTNYAKPCILGLIEPNADWNSVFSNAARTNGGAPSSPIRLSANYPGSGFMDLTFGNARSASGAWSTIARYNLTSVETTDDFYDLAIAPQDMTASSSSGGPTLSLTNITGTLPELGFPYPRYFLSETSTAVLNITSFLMQGPLSQTCQDAVTEFLELSREAGMRKLVIDLQGNGGGTVILRVDLFKQLFLTIEFYVSSRMRAHSSLDIIGNTLQYGDAEQLEGVSIYYQTSVDMDGQDVASWADYYGPYEEGGGFFTSTYQEHYNFSDAEITLLQSGNGIIVFGYANESDVAPRDFAPEDILL